MQGHIGHPPGGYPEPLRTKVRHCPSLLLWLHDVTRGMCWGTVLPTVSDSVHARTHWTSSGRLPWTTAYQGQTRSFLAVVITRCDSWEWDLLWKCSYTFWLTLTLCSANRCIDPSLSFRDPASNVEEYRVPDLVATLVVPWQASIHPMRKNSALVEHSDFRLISYHSSSFQDLRSCCGKTAILTSTCSCSAQSLYTIKVLHCHGMNVQVLCVVYKTVVLAKVLYASSAWWDSSPSLRHWSTPMTTEISV